MTECLLDSRVGCCAGHVLRSKHEQKQQIVDIGLGRAGDDKVTQALEKMVAVIACQEIVGFKSSLTRADDSITRYHSTCSVCGTIRSIGGQSNQDNIGPTLQRQC